MISVMLSLGVFYVVQRHSHTDHTDHKFLFLRRRGEFYPYFIATGILCKEYQFGYIFWKKTEPMGF